ncbi:MAG: 5-oxoprolinase subunit PxpB [Flavipsychrobacter sp.]|nr:5-oxoprolinase subunit PxpB [Flavipsychrobacter sp.]
MAQEDSFHIYPIAESAITIEYGKGVSIQAHQKLLQLQQIFHLDQFHGFLDTTITYNSLTVFFNPAQLFSEGQHSPLAFVHEEILSRLPLTSGHNKIPLAEAGNHLIPVCYEGQMAPDLEVVAGFHHTEPASIIEAHCSQDWYVFMIGFNPGFAYMGLLPDSLATPRKASPALKVPAGSVGIAGQQTGIYPNSSPGGWQIIGRTPLSVFNRSDQNPCLFKPGDRVRFTPIDSPTFLYLNQHENP